MRGDLFRYRPGHEQHGERRCVVLQTDRIVLSTVLIAPTSTRVEPTMFRPWIDIRGERTFVQVEQLTAVDTDRLGEFLGRLSPHELAEVDGALRLMLGLLA